jgi:hypothetical protein
LDQVATARDLRDQCRQRDKQAQDNHDYPRALQWFSSPEKSQLQASE